MKFKNSSLYYPVFIVLIALLIIAFPFWAILSFESPGCKKIKSLLQSQEVAEKLSSCGRGFFIQGGADYLDKEFDRRCLDFLDISGHPSFVVDKVFKDKKTYMIAVGVGYRDQIFLVNENLSDTELSDLKIKFTKVSANVLYSCDL